MSLMFNFLAQQELEFSQILTIAGILVVLVLILVIFAVFMSYFRWWIQSFLTGAGVSLWDLIGMTFRKVKASIIVPSKIMATQAGLNDPEMTTRALERRTTLPVETYRWSCDR